MTEITFEHVSKAYSPGMPVVDDFTLEIADGEFMVFVGPSGSGKTTALRMIAGLERPTGGLIRLGDDDVTDLPPRERDIAMVFQNYALYPNMTVAQNMGFGLKIKKVAKDDIARRVNEAAEMMALTPYLGRKPSDLSGGQRQRVAMGRAIVREPKAFLMDEPLSNLDAKLRVSMRTTLVALHARLGVTTVYVTHDQVEAMTLGTRVAVLRAGRLQQCDTPQQLFERPCNLFVAGFIGTPTMNLAEAQLRGEGDELVVCFGENRWVLPAPLVQGNPDLASYRDRPVIVGIRPTAFTGPIESGSDREAVMDVKVLVTEDLGSERNVFFEVDSPSVSVDHIGTPPVPVDRIAGKKGKSEEDETVMHSAILSVRSMWVARLDPGPAIAHNAPARLGFDPGGVHVFDPVTGNTVAHPVIPVGDLPVRVRSVGGARGDLTVEAP
jgi:multiple sugar transport system ATP-binding protein